MMYDPAILANPANLSMGASGINASPFDQPYAAPMGTTLGIQPATPFVWGEGGARLTPDQLALRQKLALQQSQADYSPIQSPWQGVARVAGNIEGALDLKAVDKQAAAAEGQRQSVAAGLASSDPVIQNQAVTAALMGTDASNQKFATDVYNRAHPNNDTVNDYNFRKATIGKQGADDWLRQSGDKFVTATLPNGQFYAGPQSGLATMMQGGVPAPVPATPVGKLTPIDGGAAPKGAGMFPDPMNAPGVMTSGRRTVEGNRAVGGVPNSHHLTGSAADYTGTTMAELESYFGPNARYLNEGSHIHVTLPGYTNVPYFGRNGTAGM